MKSYVPLSKVRFLTVLGMIPIVIGIPLVLGIWVVTDQIKNANQEPNIADDELENPCCYCSEENNDYNKYAENDYEEKIEEDGSFRLTLVPKIN